MALTVPFRVAPVVETGDAAFVVTVGADTEDSSATTGTPVPVAPAAGACAHPVNPTGEGTEE